MEESPINKASAVRAALQEDIGSGDATTESIFPPDDRLSGSFVAKADGVIAGLEVTSAVFHELDPACRFDKKVSDSSRISSGTEIAAITGPARAILTGERTALNFLQRMSGIATSTRSFVDAVEGTGCTILDTRKTAPGLREFDKRAVLIGGGQNHRHGLFDMVLIKDNHIDAAGTIGRAVELVRSGPHTNLPIEVECRTLDDVSECIALKVDRLLLDNMSVETVAEAVRIADNAVPLEVSGNISLQNVRSYAETGVTFISVGALTHSVTAMDISLNISPLQ